MAGHSGRVSQLGADGCLAPGPDPRHSTGPLGMSKGRSADATVTQRRQKRRTRRPPAVSRPSRVTDASHGADGRFVSGNQVARQSGIFAMHHPPALREAADAFALGVVADLGGEAELSTLERAYVTRLRDLEITQRVLAADLATRGVVTPAGGVRRPFAAYLAALDRFDRLAQRLGVRRRARTVPSAHELLRHPPAHTDEDETGSPDD